MIIVKTEQEIDAMREPCAIVRDTLTYIGSLVRPGVSTQELDERAEAYIRSRGRSRPVWGIADIPPASAPLSTKRSYTASPVRASCARGTSSASTCAPIKTDSTATVPVPLRSGRSTRKRANSSALRKNAFGRQWKTCARARRCTTSAPRTEACGRKRIFRRARIRRARHRARHARRSLRSHLHGKRGTGVRLRAGTVLCIEPMILAGDRRVKWWRRLDGRHAGSKACRPL